MEFLLWILLFEEVAVPAAVVVTPAVIGACALLLVGYFAKLKVNAWDRHIRECGDKNEHVAVMQEQIKTIGKQVDDISKDVKLLLTHMPPAPLLPQPRSTRAKK